MRTTLLHDFAVKMLKAMIRIYSDSILCLGKCHEYPQPTEAWRLSGSRNLLNIVNGTDLTENHSSSSGKISQDTTLQLLREIQRTMEENKILPEKFEDRIIFMSVHNDIDWGKAGNEDFCMSNSSSVAAYARRFPEGHWSFLGPGTEEKWYGTHIHKPNGLWNNSAEMMMLHLRGSGHPKFRATSALDRGSSEGKGGGTLSIHYNGDSTTAESLFRIIISVNQLSVYGAIADWCQKFAQQISDHSFSNTRETHGGDE